MVYHLKHNDLYKLLIYTVNDFGLSKMQGEYNDGTSYNVLGFLILFERLRKNDLISSLKENKLENEIKLSKDEKILSLGEDFKRFVKKYNDEGFLSIEIEEYKNFNKLRNKLAHDFTRIDSSYLESQLLDTVKNTFKLESGIGFYKLLNNFILKSIFGFC